MGLLRLAMLGLVGAVFLSCEKLVLDPDGVSPKPNDTATTTAKVRVSNAITHFPGTYTILVYPVTAMTVQDPYAYRLGNVAENSASDFNIPAGSWRVGVALPDGTSFPLVNSVGSTEWVILSPVAGKNYVLDFYTDIGGNNVWSSNMPRQ